jgi:predicted RNA binding protein YcfA (HicA-like mRNA interferase family)
MTKLPNISGKDCIKALAKMGYYQKRQEGSYIILRKDYPYN